MPDIFSIARQALANCTSKPIRGAILSDSAAHYTLVVRTADAASIAGHSTAAPASSASMSDMDNDEEWDPDLH